MTGEVEKLENYLLDLLKEKKITVTELSFPKEGETEQFPMVITPREIDQAVEHAARTIALSINCALHPDLTIEELSALVS